MALPTWQDLKILLRVQTVAEDGGSSDTPTGTGNGLLARMIERAQARVERYIQRPLVAASMTAVDRADSLVVWGSVTRLIFPMSPLSQVPDDAPVITDVDGITVDSATYDIDYTAGLFTAHPGVSFDNGPYTMTAKAGLSAHPDYARFEPDLAQAILDVAVDLYSWRSPAVTQQSAGGGVSEARDQKSGLPKRVCAVLGGYKRIGWA